MPFSGRPGRRQVLGMVSALLLPMPIDAAPRTLWPRGKSGAVSLTYDDGLDSQLDLAVPALEKILTVWHLSRPGLAFHRINETPFGALFA